MSSTLTTIKPLVAQLINHENHSILPDHKLLLDHHLENIQIIIEN